VFGSWFPFYDNYNNFDYRFEEHREIWFAIKAKNKNTNYETFDNNNGWNYTTY